MARAPRQRVLIENVPDDDPGTSLPPLPPGFESFTLPVEGDPVIATPHDTEAEGPLADTTGEGGSDESPGLDAIPPGTIETGATTLLADVPTDDGTGNPHTLDALGPLVTIDPLTSLDGEVIPPEKPTPGKPRYEQRIRIVEAWQFVEGVARAPAWVDKNWAAWGDDDPLRGIPAGPSIRVPGPGGTMICRHGDYIARQMMTLLPGLPPEERIEVWPRESFERFFIRT